MIAAALLAAVLLFATSGSAVAGTLTAEVDGVRVELLSKPSRPQANADTEYVVRLVDRAGHPVTGVHVTLRGAMADGMRVIAPLRPATEVGTYGGRLLFIMEGAWDLTLQVTRAGRHFELPLTEHVGR